MYTYSAQSLPFLKEMVFSKQKKWVSETVIGTDAKGVLAQICNKHLYAWKLVVSSYKPYILVVDSLTDLTMSILDLVL